LPGQNIYYDDMDVRELHFIANGKNQGNGVNEHTETEIVLKGIRCATNCSEAIVEVEEVEAEFRYWSDVKNWPNETLPVAGDDVHIISGWKMILDIEETPILNFVRVNGILIFDETKDIHLRAKHIFVRAGEMHIGNETHPYEKNAQITLHGEKNAATIVYDNAIEAGNKLIANVNVINMYGKPRTTKMARLHQEANMNDKEIKVETGLDLKAGDMIALITTSLKFDANENHVISAYNNETGVITLVDKVKYNHYGAPESTASKYNGVDIRGEVLILTRNIRIVGEDVESWGCQIVTSDTVEIDVTTMEIKQRTGQMNLHNVEVYNCSQIDTERAAIRFEGATTLPSSIINSTFHNGLGWGGRFKNAANLILQNNIWFSFRPVAVAIDSARNITFDSNFVGGTVERTTFEALD